MTKELSWQALYHAALLELDPRELWSRIGDAEAAIQRRIAQIKNNRPGSSEEAASLEAALRGLRVLAKECKPEWSAGSGPALNLHKETS